MNIFFWLIPSAALISLGFAFFFYRQMRQAPAGSEVMIEIARHIREGAWAYLKQQYKVVALVFLIICVLLCILSYGFNLQNKWLPFAFLTCGSFSCLAGFVGMRTATYASSRTAQAVFESIDSGLKIAFRSGAVMGLTVVGLALIDYSFWFLVLTYFLPETNPSTKAVLLTSTMLTFGMGTSLQALFARVGGGIFTKAADVGADLVGKIEADIPEDDPRNPAAIADNVGDNVGDVAGMGADLYESFYGAILAAASLGAMAFWGKSIQMEAVLAPAILGSLGAFFSIFGIFLVRAGNSVDCSGILKALGHGVNGSAILVAVFSLGILKSLGFENYLGIWGAVLTGLGVGVFISKVTEYCTSQTFRPTQQISEQAVTGPATVILAGLGAGMISTVAPVLAVGIGSYLAFGFATGFDFSQVNLGLYGIGIAAVGMLSNLGVTLATDAYGPIADNAGGNAQMSKLDPEIRRRTDILDSVGNTTAATGKGFAIGSAALTALALMASYAQELKVGLIRLGHGATIIQGKPLIKASIEDILCLFEAHLINPKVLVGLFIGAMSAFLFCGLTINAVGRAASRMVEEVRRQFREIPGILEGTARPDYANCVRISTSAAQKEMIAPAVCSVVIPLLVGYLLGPAGVFGLLAGTLTSGTVLAVFMANSGGAWDNAKKYIEEGHLGGKGSTAHKASVIGDTIGDPFKDTAGPSLNLLIKMMTIVSIVTAGITLVCNGF